MNTLRHHALVTAAVALGAGLLLQFLPASASAAAPGVSWSNGANRKGAEPGDFLASGSTSSLPSTLPVSATEIIIPAGGTATLSGAHFGGPEGQQCPIDHDSYGYQLNGGANVLVAEHPPYVCKETAPGAVIGPVATATTVRIWLEDISYQELFYSNGNHGLVSGSGPFIVSIMDSGDGKCGMNCERIPKSNEGNFEVTVTISTEAVVVPPACPAGEVRNEDGECAAALSLPTNGSNGGSNCSLPAPTDINVTPHNGSATLSWTPPTLPSGCSITGFTITAVPYGPSLTATIPAGDAHSSTEHTAVTSQASLDGTTVTNLAEDCHTTYTFRVATDSSTTQGPSASTTTPIRPSGVVSAGSAPPVIVVVVDGAPSSQPTAKLDTYDPVDVPSYCPMAPVKSASTSKHFLASTTYSPAVQGFLDTWNYAGENHQNEPLDLKTGKPTRRYLLDWFAASGGIVVPYSYAGITCSVATKRCTVPGYKKSETLSGNLGLQAQKLHIEIADLRKLFPSTPVIVFGHSYGGLITEWYWQHYGQGKQDGVKHVFSLDSPINGVKDCFQSRIPSIAEILCGLKSSYSGAMGTLLTNILWSGLIAHDNYIIHHDGDGSFNAVGTDGDQAYTNGDLPENGLLSQLVYAGCSQVANETFSGPLAGSDIEYFGCSASKSVDIPSACPITKAMPSVVKQRYHFIVKYCPGDLYTIDRLVASSFASVPLPRRSQYGSN